MNTDVTNHFNDARKRLIETGTRNRLIHVNREITRGNVLNIVNERSDEVYRMLSGGDAMRFLATGIDGGLNIFGGAGEGEGDIDLSNNLSDAHDEARYTDKLLETRLGPDALSKKLLKIALEAKTAEEESGINMLFLALGFLTWYEAKGSKISREAPLILLPVSLVRSQKTSKYDLRLRDEDIVTNLPLYQRLKDDFGVLLPEVEIGETWLPSDYFHKVAARIEEREGWNVTQGAIQLGFFSFSKLLMFRDLDANEWPEGALADHALTKGLLYEGFASHPPLFGKDDALDDLLPPEKLFHVVDADASQAKVIEEARAGRHMVVQGPPGTGKSQTITNIIAAAVKDGKRVLFLAEKMAALSVVHDRLVKTGLRDICLELHSRSANKRAVLDELARTLAQTTAIPEAPPPPSALKEHRDLLNGFSKALHQPIGETGETAYSALGIQSLYLGMNVPPPRLESPSLAFMSRQTTARLCETIRKYVALIEQEGYGAPHPFEGTRRLTLQPTELARLSLRLGEAVQKINTLVAVMNDASDALGIAFPAVLGAAEAALEILEGLKGLPQEGAKLALSMPESFDKNRIDQTLMAGTLWLGKRQAAATVFVDAAFSTPAHHLRAPLAAGMHSWLERVVKGRYREASLALAGMLRGALPESPLKRLELLDMLLDVGDVQALVLRDKDYCIRIFGDVWRGEHSNFEVMQQVMAWRARLAASPYAIPLAAAVALAKRADALLGLSASLHQAEAAARNAVEEIILRLDFDLAAIGQADLATSDLTVLRTHFSLMESGADSYDAWVKRSQYREELNAAGLQEVEERLRLGQCAGEEAVQELRFARAEAIWNEALDCHPHLRKLKDLSRQELVAAFKRLDRGRMKENVIDILSSHLNQVPQGAQGEMGVIRGEIAKKRSNFALRKLFDKAGEAIQRIKPVLLMSPISVAQFLPPGKITFDLLIIDEASQVRPEDALGAIARAKQIVVVGDKKQLPPSSFFDRLMTENEDDRDTHDDETNAASDVTAKAGEMESILTLCEARGLSSRMLTWHYRSRDPSLIMVSNREFYEGNLILPPSPLQKNPAFGLCLTQVQGVYDKGGKRDNRMEGEAIVDRTAEHARNHPTLSLGIVTFSSAQRDLITLLLEERRRQDPTLNEFLREGQAEDLFVKNIENVQGDERDVILVSVGYGPSIPGIRMTSLSFGPVNREGGERRLNVLFTRARIRCEIFTSFDPGDMDPSRSNAEGPRIFKRFLDYAKYGVLDNAAPNVAEPDSPFEEDVARVIRDFGFLADHQVGSAGFRIDLGVRHPDSPGNYLLAVECDGAAYHSALWARERDRLRQDVLEHLGWRFHRIWSTDWFYRRSDEIERLRLALQEARELAGQEIMMTGANHKRERLTETPGPSFVQAPAPLIRHMPLYQRASFRQESAKEHFDATQDELADLIVKIIDIEGPVHTDEIASRISACYGRQKTGPRIAAAARQALQHAVSKYPDLRTEDDFWFTREQADTPPVRNRSEEIGKSVAKPDRTSFLEIKAAAALARADNAGGEEAELIRTIARLLGFQRAGPELQSRIMAALRA